MQRFARFIAAATVSLALGACSHAQTSATATPDQSAASPAATAIAASAAPAAAATASAVPAYTDLGNVYGADKIEQLSRLGVFGPPTGPAFLPNAPILRRTFVKWAFAANNKLAKSDDKMIRPATASDTSAFKDFASSDPDFAEVQGMQNANISVGFPDGTFKANQPITREQAVSIASLLSCAYTASFTGGNASAGRLYMPKWKDASQVTLTYVAVMAGCGDQVTDIVGRTYGKILAFHPQQPVTRAEAALMLYSINGRTAADALQATPAPQGT